MADQNTCLIFFVNGKKIVDWAANPEWTLLSYLRKRLNMPGTKLGCGEGGCGACTVMASKFYQEENKVRHSSINACLTPIGSVHGLAITTVEGIGSINTRLHPVQERLSKSHGSQCGFCTPGFVMSMYTLLRNNPKPSMQEIEENLVGNLCRCTGYRPILEGFRTFSAESANTQTKWLPLGCGKSNCCQVMQNGDCELQNGSEDYLTENGVVNGHENGFCDLQHHDEHQSTAVLFDAGSFIPYDPSQEIIFPPELKLLHQKTLMAKGLTLRSPRMTFHLTTTLERLLELKDKFRDAKIVIGNTEIGVELKYKNRHYPVIINPLEIQELLDIKVTDDYVEVGAAVTLSAIEDHFRKLVNILEESKVGVLVAILKMLERFGGKQIRNVACLGGNIMTGSPISDLNPIFLATGVILKFRNVEREREVKMDENFYIGYRKVNASDNDVLISVKIPYTAEDEYFMAYKQSRRRDDDIAIVNSAMKVKFKPESDFVDAMSLVYGGMAETTIVALRTMKKFEGRRWNRSFLESVTDSLIEELQLDPSAPGGMTQYRMTLCSSFFLKFYLKVRQELERKYPSLLQTTDGEYAEENEDEEEYIPTKSLQFYQNVPVGQEVIDPFGRPLAHSEAIQHVTGEATYTDDIPKYANELFGALVLSSRSYAKIISIDPSEAIRIEGVAGFFCSKDLPGKRNRNPRFEDEEVFASETVTCLGQVIGLVVAEDETTAQTASKLVKVAYEDLQNPIISIEDAIEAKSFFGHVNPFKIETGDLDSGFTQSDHVLEGELRVGGQEHFYLETHCIVAIPHENKEMEVICSSQDLTTLHKCLSNALGVPQNRVRCRVRKIGGGFGGKETRGILSYVPIAVAASKLRRPVRMMLDRQEDMLVSGTRNPFLGKWKVGFTANGSIKALEALLYLNAGCSVDLSADVMAEAVTALQNSYRLENFKVIGQCCKTNLPSNTAFRGFGTPQAILIMEDIINRIAHFLDIDPREIQEKHLFKPNGECTAFGQKLTDCKVQQCWDEVVRKSDYDNRRKSVDEFNRISHLRKRGLAIAPTTFSIGFCTLSCNQGAALLHVYTDGSVLITHGGVEMGQGLHIKMAQVASRALKIPIEKIYINETATDKVPNTTSSAASLSSDLYGAAILDACQKLLDRIAPYKKRNPSGQWVDWIKEAYTDRVALSATGFHKIPHMTGWNYKDLTKPTEMFSYYCYGAGVSEVEIDCLTGDHRVLRTDIVMDVGTSMNPAIDIGQVEGAFAQGMGLFTMEELMYSPRGLLLTRGPGAYKIPSVCDIPREFNVTLLRGSENPRAVYSSKAVGEPPLCLASAVFLAIKDAITYKRGGRRKGGDFRLDSPATAERIRMACEDTITLKVERAEKPGSFTPWSITV